MSEGGAVGTIGSERKSSLRRQNSVPDLQKVMMSAKDKKGGGGIAFSDMVKMTFSEPTFAKAITPLLYDMMSPLLKTIEASVTATVAAAVESVNSKVVKEMIESNRKLQGSVTEQTRAIQEQSKVIKSQEKIIQNQNKAIEDQAKLLDEKKMKQ